MQHPFAVHFATAHLPISFTPLAIPPLSSRHIRPTLLLKKNMARNRLRQQEPQRYTESELCGSSDSDDDDNLDLDELIYIPALERRRLIDCDQQTLTLPKILTQNERVGRCGNAYTRRRRNAVQLVSFGCLARPQYYGCRDDVFVFGK